MWTATGAGFDDETHHVPVLQESGELPSSRVALALIREHLDEIPNGRGLIRYIEAEVESEDNELSVARRPVQEVWASSERTSSRELSENESLIPAIRRTSHLRTLVLLPWTPNTREIDLRYSLKSLDPKVATGAYTLDWRAYLGSGTAILDGRTGPWSSYWRPQLQELRFILRGLPRVAGFVVGFVLRHTGKRFDLSFRTDPTFFARRQRLEAEHQSIADQVPDLATAGSVAVPSAVVFVHGTRSHGLEGLKDLAPFTAQPPSLFRYEHDTFLSVRANGEELASIVNGSIRTHFLTFVGHSRGGLVARFARMKLKQMQYPARIKIMTFGTPHLGTPLINRVQQNVALVFRLGSAGLLGIPLLTRLEYVLSCLPGIRAVPAGISYMEQGSAALEDLNSLDSCAGIDCWGGRFDAACPQGGYGIVLDGLLAGILSDGDNDLVVPTASARGFGVPQPVVDCGHSGYFRVAHVREQIRAACPGILT
jgi:hypothetical protein